MFFDCVLLFEVNCSLYKLQHIHVAGEKKAKLHLFPQIATDSGRLNNSKNRKFININGL